MEDISKFSLAIEDFGTRILHSFWTTKPSWRWHRKPLPRWVLPSMTHKSTWAIWHCQSQRILSNGSSLAEKMVVCHRTDYVRQVSYHNDVQPVDSYQNLQRWRRKRMNKYSPLFLDNSVGAYFQRSWYSLWNWRPCQQEPTGVILVVSETKVRSVGSLVYEDMGESLAS